MNQHDSCQMCKKKFTPGDDVVICPHCGAPYHRECYLKEGRCMYEEKHAQGFEYVPPAKAGENPAQAQQQPESAPPPPPTGPGPRVGGPVPPQYSGGSAQGAEVGGGIVCPACSTLNESSNIFCERCGYPLHSTVPPGQPGAGQNPGGPQYQPPGQPPPFMAGGGWQQAYGAGADMQGEFDGIDKRDWATFIGQSTPSYFLRMNQQDTRNTKFGFTLSAFFVSYLYFAYRKMWVWALVAFLIHLALSAPTYLWLLMDAGLNPLPGLSLESVAMAQNVTTYLVIVRNLFFGLFALYLYRKDAGKKIRALKDSGLAGPAYQEALQKKGGVSVAGVLVILAVLLGLNFLIIYYGGEPLMTYVLSNFWYPF